MTDRNKLVRDNFIRWVEAEDLPELTPTSSPDLLGLSRNDLIELFESQLLSRHLDLQSRIMQKQGQSFYTIGSAGHEGNAAVAKAFRADDMAFLHYRSGAFCIQRSKAIEGQTPLEDMLLSFAASSEDPTAGGRHKVLGSKILMIPPQTSTIASHLPKAMGTAFSIGLGKRLKDERCTPSGNSLQTALADDSVVVCNFGDASANHSTAQGAINSAAWCAYQSIPMPIVFICEDNGIGISTKTPDGWIAANFKHRAGLHYLFCDGLNLIDTYEKSLLAAKIAREQKKPVFLHIRMIRLLGHAGSDSEFVYRDIETIEQIERQDPLLHTAKLLLKHEIFTPAELVEKYLSIEADVAAAVPDAVRKPKLETAEQVMASLVPRALDEAKLSTLYRQVSNDERAALFAHEKHNLAKPQHLAKLINWTLLDAMAEQDNMVMLGEDIAKKGGVYNVTAQLCQRFGTNRVMNTLLDEQSILGGAIGLAHNGFLPVPEIQFLAYVHNAEDQIRGEAATLSFFSNQQYTNPMVIRIAGLAYQKGFGGHFHNDNSFAVFRDIPGLILACPSNGEDGIELMRSCLKLAQEQQRVVVFLEPIALYMTKDLHQEGDGLWTYPYLHQTLSEHTVDMSVKVHGDGKQVCILTYGNGCYLSMKAKALLEMQGINCRVVDLRFLAPLDEQGIVAQVNACGHVLIVDECRETGSISEALVTLICEQANTSNVSRVTACDSFIPLGTAAYNVLPSVDDIVAAANKAIGTNTTTQDNEVKISKVLLS